jgi:hypothetical protein
VLIIIFVWVANLLKNFSDYKSKLTKIKEGYYKLNNSVIVYDTFGYITKDINKQTSTSTLKSQQLKLAPYTSRYNKMYNLRTVNFEPSGWFAKLWFSLFGGSRTEYRYFDDDHMLE